MNIWRLAGREEERQKKKGKVRALKRGGELQTNSISGRQESGQGMERNIQSNAIKSVWESGRQSPAQEVKEIKENRQWVREKERKRRTERERQKQADREIHDLSLSLTMALHVVPSLAGELLESGMWNVGFQAWK